MELAYTYASISAFVPVPRKIGRIYCLLIIGLGVGQLVGFTAGKSSNSCSTRCRECPFFHNIALDRSNMLKPVSTNVCFQGGKLAPNEGFLPSSSVSCNCTSARDP